MSAQREVKQGMMVLADALLRRFPFAVTFFTAALKGNVSVTQADADVALDDTIAVTLRYTMTVDSRDYTDVPPEIEANAEFLFSMGFSSVTLSRTVNIGGGAQILEFTAEANWPRGMFR